MRQERAERTRRALTFAAAKLFDRVGFERTTLAEVSGLAAVSKGALSFHFASKAELADTVQALACTSANNAIEELRSKDLPGLQTLIDMTHLVAYQLAYDEMTRAGVQLARELGTSPDASRHLFVNWQQAFVDVALEAEKDCSLHPEAAAHSVAEMALCLASGPRPAWRGLNVDVRGQLTGMWELLLPGLTPEDSPWPLRAAGTECIWPHPAEQFAQGA